MPEIGSAYEYFLVTVYAISVKSCRKMRGTVFLPLAPAAF